MSLNPSPSEVAFEARVLEVAKRDAASANVLSCILRTAAEATDALSFTVCPVDGYDHDDISAAIRDMMPPHGDALRKVCEDNARDHLRCNE